MTLEALCEEYEQSEGKLTKESVIQRLNEIRGFKVNQLVLDVVDKVTKCLTKWDFLLQNYCRYCTNNKNQYEVAMRLKLLLEG